MISDDDDGIVVEALSSRGPDLASDFRRLDIRVHALERYRRPMHGGLLVRAALIRVCTPSLSATLSYVVMAIDRHLTRSISKPPVSSRIECSIQRHFRKILAIREARFDGFGTVTSQIVSQAADPKTRALVIY